MPKDRPRAHDIGAFTRRSALALEEAIAMGRRVMRCDTCEWAVRPGDECAEKEFVLGCIHWRRRGQ